LGQNGENMIVTATDLGWRCITQPDHARLRPDHPRRQELLEAVLEHDNGWREADSAPRLHPSAARPHDFASHPRDDRFEIWRRGIERYSAERPYVATLILEHALYLHRNRRGSAPWDDFLEELRGRRDELATAAGLDSRTLRSDYRWLHIADLLSLAVCADWREPFERCGIRGCWRPDALETSPFPFAGTTRFSVPCRYLPRGDFASDSEVATTLAACRWQRLSFRVAPPRPASNEP
jgi:hypothetical protein